LSLNVESDRFFLALSSWVSFDVGVVATIVAIGGSLCCYIFASQQSWDRRSWEE